MQLDIQIKESQSPSYILVEGGLFFAGMIAVVALFSLIWTLSTHWICGSSVFESARMFREKLPAKGLAIEYAQGRHTRGVTETIVFLFPCFVLRLVPCFVWTAGDPGSRFFLFPLRILMVGFGQRLSAEDACWQRSSSRRNRTWAQCAPESLSSVRQTLVFGIVRRPGFLQDLA